MPGVLTPLSGVLGTAYKACTCSTHAAGWNVASRLLTVSRIGEVTLQLALCCYRQKETSEYDSMLTGAAV
jgi:hypothetical protein